MRCFVLLCVVYTKLSNVLSVCFGGEKLVVFLLNKVFLTPPPAVLVAVYLLNMPQPTLQFNGQKFIAFHSNLV